MKVFLYLILALALPMMAMAQPIITVIDDVLSNDLTCPPADLTHCAQGRFTVPVTGIYSVDSWIKCPDSTSCQWCVSCAVITAIDAPTPQPMVCSAGCTNPCQRTCTFRLVAGARYVLNVCFQGCPTGPVACSPACEAVACVRGITGSDRPCW